MKICSVSDVHFTQSGLPHQRPPISTPDADVLTVSGDLTIRGNTNELNSFKLWLDSQPQKYKVVIAGNHDFCFQDSRQFEARAILSKRVLGEEVVYLQDEEATIEGVRFYGAPWQPWHHDWAFNLRRGKEIKEKWDLIPSNIDVLLVHGPPFGYGDRVTSGERVGCSDMLNAIDEKKPKIVCFGHIHEDTGVWKRNSTVLVNCSMGYKVGSQDWARRKPFVFEIVDGVVKY